MAAELHFPQRALKVKDAGRADWSAPMRVRRIIGLERLCYDGLKVKNVNLLVPIDVGRGKTPQFANTKDWYRDRDSADNAYTVSCLHLCRSLVYST